MTPWPRPTRVSQEWKGGSTGIGRALNKGSAEAIALDPRSPGAHFAYAGGVLAPMRRWDEALSECRIAEDLDPFSVQMAYCTPWTHIFQGKLELALAEFRQLEAERPGSFSSGVAIAAMGLGRESEALSTMEQGKVDIPALLHHNLAQLGFLGYCYGRVGRRTEALDIERQLRDASRTQYISPGVMSLVYLGLGQLDDARRAASREIQEHSFSVYTLAGPLFTELRDDPAFAALLKTTGIPFRSTPLISTPYLSS